MEDEHAKADIRRGEWEAVKEMARTNNDVLVGTADKPGVIHVVEDHDREIYSEKEGLKARMKTCESRISINAFMASILTSALVLLVLKLLGKI